MADKQGIDEVIRDNPNWMLLSYLKEKDGAALMISAINSKDLLNLSGN